MIEQEWTVMSNGFKAVEIETLTGDVTIFRTLLIFRAP